MAAKKATVRTVSSTFSASPPPGSTANTSAMSATTPSFHASCTPGRLGDPRAAPDHLIVPEPTSTRTSEPSATR